MYEFVNGNAGALFEARRMVGSNYRRAMIELSTNDQRPICCQYIVRRLDPGWANKGRGFHLGCFLFTWCLWFGMIAI